MHILYSIMQNNLKWIIVPSEISKKKYDILTIDSIVLPIKSINSFNYYIVLENIIFNILLSSWHIQNYM